MLVTGYPSIDDGITNSPLADVSQLVIVTLPLLTSYVRAPYVAASALSAKTSFKLGNSSPTSPASGAAPNTIVIARIKANDFFNILLIFQNPPQQMKSFTFQIRYIVIISE